MSPYRSFISSGIRPSPLAPGVLGPHVAAMSHVLRQDWSREVSACHIAWSSTLALCVVGMLWLVPVFCMSVGAVVAALFCVASWSMQSFEVRLLSGAHRGVLVVAYAVRCPRRATVAARARELKEYHSPPLCGVYRLFSRRLYIPPHQLT